jgi:NADH-quinone oxidoreductase subunit J
MLVEILFYAFAAVLVGASIGVITARNPVFSALYLVLAFFTSAVIWLLLEAEFLALVLVLVYVGAVMVLFLFVVMMLDINIEELRKGFTRYAPLGAIIAFIMVFEIINVVYVKKLGLDAMPASPPLPEGYSNTRELGAILYTDYVYPFQIAAVILLVAIVAAIILTLRQRPGHKVQDTAKQVAVRREDRVRIVKMDAEKRETTPEEGA